MYYGPEDPPAPDIPEPPAPDTPDTPDDAPDIGNADTPEPGPYNEYGPIGEPAEGDIYVPSDTSDYYPDTGDDDPGGW